MNIIFNGSTYTFPDINTLNLLDASNDIEEAFIGCGRGVCGRCVVRIESGSEHINALTPAELQTLSVIDKSTDHYRLLCQCEISGDVALCNNNV